MRWQYRDQEKRKTRFLFEEGGRRPGDVVLSSLKIKNSRKNSFQKNDPKPEELVPVI